jgi:nitrite reductase/ring-hydroxylating ferredoxin subunit
MSDPTDSRIRIGSIEEFPEGRGRAVDYQDTRVAVFRRGDGWFALQDSCPHMGASLAEGSLEGWTVVCHWHDKRFDLKTGESDMRSGACARVYTVEVVGRDVFLERSRSDSVVDDDEEEWIPFDPEHHFKKK